MDKNNEVSNGTCGEIFALDIGTRKVMGIVGIRREDYIEIQDVEVIEHTNRSMLDGQIHHIEDVAKTVKKIKENLERRRKAPLEKVAVAVAGRNLLTFKSKASHEFEFEQEITLDMVRNLELEAIEGILSDSEKDVSRFYCAGYSPVYYELDGSRIAALSGHRGKSISCELIVTFLPRVVLESMFAALKKAGLSVTQITLEPIAALNAIIPAEIRHLDLILIDIGAGTSDLALTKDGYVFAYGMVAEAGDEITESISELLLADFSAAETIKRSLSAQQTIEYQDIWGRSHIIDTKDVTEKISGGVKKLAESIARKAQELREGTPQAVVVVGGGSLTVNLISELAASFGLPADKIGARLPSSIKKIKDTTRRLTGPEAVTPIGIALMAAESWGLRFIEIEVNQKKLRLIDFLQKKDVLGALTLSGAIANKRLYPKPGPAITCTINGELKIIRGSLGEPARITLNGRPISSLSEKINEGDAIEFKEAVDGVDASCLIQDLLSGQSIRIIFNQEPLEIMPLVVMNGKETMLNTAVLDRANIWTLPLTIKDALRHKGIDTEGLSQRQILVNINGNPRILTQRNYSLLCNGNSAGLDSEIAQNDIIEFSSARPTAYRIKDVVDIPEGAQIMHINVAGKDIEISVEPAQIFMDGRLVSPDEFLIDAAEIKVYILKEKKVILSEIFRYIDFNPLDAVGKKMRILVNDAPAGFTTPLTEGSRVKIIFEERN
jgi:cell division protein FtsA